MPLFYTPFFAARVQHAALAVLLIGGLWGQALAEQCWQVKDCRNLTGYIRINKTLENGNHIAPDAQRLFGVGYLPRTDSYVRLRRSAIVRDFSHPEQDDRPLQLKDRVSWDEGQFIPAGTRLRILGYLRRMHLFVLVQVVEDVGRPSDTALPFQFDYDYFV